MHGCFAIAAALMSQVPLTPLDAFRANYAATKVEAHYEYRRGVAPANTLKHLRTWSMPDVAYELPLHTQLHIEWACDGVAERLTCEPLSAQETTGDSNTRTESPSGSNLVAGGNPFEVLFDGWLQADHHFDDATIEVRIGLEPGIARTGRGPFCWWSSFRFPSSLSQEWDNVSPTIHRTTFHGFNVIVSVYQDAMKDNGWKRLEVYYDPSIGYLPRYVRRLHVTKRMANIRELYLYDASPCKKGGFVPTEYYETEFSSDIPKRLEANDLEAPDSAPPNVRRKLLVGHLKLKQMKPQTGHVGLVRLANAHTLSGRSGSSPLFSKAPLTVERIKALLGKKLDPVDGRDVLIVDSEGLSRPTHPSHSWLWLFASLIAGLVLLYTVFRRWNLTKVGVLLLFTGLAAVATGCGQSAVPSALLSASFVPVEVLNDPKQDTIPITLEIQNQGRSNVSLLKIDGGCSCRRVDNSSLPTVLAAGETKRFRAQMSNIGRSELKQHSFECETDAGKIGLTATLLQLRSHSFNPESLSSPSLRDDEEFTWDVVYEQICKSASAIRPVSEAITPELTFRKISTKSGLVNGAPNFRIQEIRYRITLVDKRLGIHKGTFSVIAGDVGPRAELPVIWRRVAYLSPNPSTVIIGPRPLRVFLNCPDESVELTRVLSVPRGIKAFISSPREVTVSMDKAGIGPSTGYVEVATTAAGRPPLRIPCYYSVEGTQSSH